MYDNLHEKAALIFAGDRPVADCAFLVGCGGGTKWVGCAIDPA